jgi:hypothetical protein
MNSTWGVKEFKDRGDVADFLSTLSAQQQALAKVTASDTVTDDKGGSYVYTNHYWHVFYPLVVGQ